MKRICVLCVVMCCSAGAFGADPAKPLFDLSKVAGMKLYKGPAEGKKLLAKQGLVITNETRLRMHEHYANWRMVDRSEVRALPCFVTTDTAVDAFGRILQKGFKQIERRNAKNLQSHLKRSWVSLANSSFGDLKVAPAVRAQAGIFIAISLKLMDDKWSPSSAAGNKLYREIAKKVKFELARIEAGKVTPRSPLFGLAIDYSLCKPRSFYAGDSELEGFYRARTFLAFPMNLRYDKAMYAALGLSVLPELKDYEDLRCKYERLFGRSNLMPIAELRRLGASKNIFDQGGGANGEYAKALLAGDIAPLLELIKDQASAWPNLPVFATQSDGARERTEAPILTAMLPKSATPDTRLMARVSAPALEGRFFPSALDVQAYCGNARAMEHILAQTEEEIREELIEGFKPRYEGGYEGEHPDGAMYYLWENIFKSLAKPGLSDKHPRFMSTPAYADKSLNTALGAWSSYRHTAQLQAEEVSGIFGGLRLVPPGYVEPNLRFWDAMAKACLSAQELFWKHDAAQREMLSLAKMCIEARSIAGAQLAGRKLSRSQLAWLGSFAHVMAEIEDSSVHNKAVDTSFVATVWSDRTTRRALHVGVARPRAIYVIIDYGGKAVLARGAVMSYREFWRPIGAGRLSDRQWRKIISRGKAQSPPKWFSSACVGKDRADKKPRRVKKRR